MQLLEALFYVKETEDSKVLGGVEGAYVNIYGYQEPSCFYDVVSKILQVNGLTVISMEDLLIIKEEDISTLDDYVQERISALTKENLSIVCGEFFTHNS